MEGATLKLAMGGATGCSLSVEPPDGDNPVCNPLAGGKGFLLCENTTATEPDFDAVMLPAADTQAVPFAELAGLTLQGLTCGGTGVRSIDKVEVAADGAGAVWFGIGRVALALVMIGLGLRGLWTGDFASVWQPAPEDLPGRAAWAYATAAVELAAGLGLLWRPAATAASWLLLAFTVLWGYTSIQVTRPFVQSVPGSLVLLPVRTVLVAIHMVEDHLVERPFDLSANHDWIGFVSAAVGALITTAVYLLIRAATRVRGDRPRSMR